MTKDVLIRVKGLQMVDEADQAEPIEVVTAGEYYLTDEQTSALECICNNNIMILNGFAGSGKSATSAMIIKMLEDNNISYTLMAPTGRAAKVLSDYTGKPAATIHRGLGYMPKNRWGYNSECQLPFDVVLVDEFSMTDIFLFLHLCEAIDFSRTKLIVVGDSAQLPSVGPGNLLYDMINSFVIPTVTLTLQQPAISNMKMVLSVSFLRMEAMKKREQSPLHGKAHHCPLPASRCLVRWILHGAILQE